MRSWPVPVQMTEDEKMVGGVLTLKQLGYMLAGLALGGTAAGVFRLPGIMRFVIYFVIQAFGFALALCQVSYTPLDNYLINAWRWWRSPRQLVFRGDE